MCLNFRFQLFNFSWNSCARIPYIVLFLLCLSVPTLSYSSQLTLAWDPNKEPDIAGYRVYYGTESKNYAQVVDTGNDTTCTLIDLVPGETYYLAATAYDDNGNESEYSEEISYIVRFIDTDGDGFDDNVDEDDDDDGMPDEWENRYGLNPLINDAAEDADGDGFTNLEEFLAGTDPAVVAYNFKPDRPELLLPQNLDITALTPELQTDIFNDPDHGDHHKESQWQILRESDELFILDVRSSEALTSLKVPDMMLDARTAYIWRVRFFDNQGTPSEWSPFGIFTTEGSLADRDGNGIPDDREIDETVDLDGDGVADIDQDDIKCLNSIDGQSQLGISIKDADTVYSITSIESQDPDESESVAESTGKPDELPLGLIKFKLLVNNPGDIAVVTLFLSEPAPEGGRWYKFNPIDKTWIDFTDNTEFNQDRTALQIALEDGGPGDADGIANGIIVDPLGYGQSTGAAVSTSNSGSDSGGSNSLGCFITTTASSPARTLRSQHTTWYRLSLILVIALLLVLIWIGYAYMRKLDGIK